MTHLGRRAFIGLLGSAAAWPIAAHGQQAMPTVGFLDSVSSETRREGTFAFRRGLSELGYFENQNVTVEHRWARGQLGRLPELTTDLLQRRVAVIVVNNAAACAAQEASAETPIVFVSGVSSISRAPKRSVSTFLRPCSPAPTR